MINSKDYSIIRKILGITGNPHQQSDDHLLTAAISKLKINTENVEEKEELGELMVGTAMLQGEWTKEVYHYLNQAYNN